MNAVFFLNTIRTFLTTPVHLVAKYVKYGIGFVIIIGVEGANKIK